MLDAIEIRVSKGIDGFTFSVLPNVREAIKNKFPGAHPANSVFISYDVKSDFEQFQGSIERSVYPLLLGVDDTNKLRKSTAVQFVDSYSGEVLLTVQPLDEQEV